MEPATHDDCWNNFLAFRGPMRGGVVSISKEQSAGEMAWNLKYACAMARIKYFRSPQSMPATAAGAAQAWLQIYNAGGKGTEDKFLKAWRQVGLT